MCFVVLYELFMVILNVCELIYYKNIEYNLIGFGCRSDFYFLGLLDIRKKWVVW